MLRLTTFGGVMLRAGGEPHVGAASQRRRLALLVLIAAAGSRQVSRDKLLGYLWPETDAERARHALRQALHALQQALGEESLFLGTSALQLNPAVITSDTQDFEEATERGEHQRVVALYKGPFLDGFFVSDAPAFEHWVDAQRAAYARTYTASLEALVEESAARGDRTAALAWSRRLAAEHPVSARYAVGLIRALADAGDRSGALQFATVHATVVRQELGTEPDAAVLTLIERLRAGDDAETGRQRASQRSSDTRITGEQAIAVARERQFGWIERMLGARYDVDANSPLPASSGSVGYHAFDRARRVPVEIHLVGAGVPAFADVEALAGQLDRVVALDHPHIAPLYEHGHSDGYVYYVVARSDGESLRDRLARERQLAVAEALTIASEIADALAYAHERGVLHGDLRPKHVTLTRAGVALAGLGISDALRRATSRDRTSATIRVGSPAYQSPEQITGGPNLDARADVYSLGCMLYEMLAGEVPYASPNPITLVTAKFTAPLPSLTARRESVRPELEAVVQRCLARTPSDRYRDARELLDALAPLRPELPRRSERSA